tara:strand:- start:460 stop:897 length:438 start_codon:yes stop_codon:yes gene_type:complete
MKLGSNEINKLIPHRSPFLFIDECEILEKGKRGIASRVFKDDEYFFQGHFPGNPIVPGVIIVEALAQTAGIIVSESLTEYDKKSVLFMSVNKAKFRKPVIPNDKIIFEVNFINKVKSVYKFFGIASKENIKVSEAEFSAMITYSK